MKPYDERTTANPASNKLKRDRVEMPRDTSQSMRARVVIAALIATRCCAGEQPDDTALRAKFPLIYAAGEGDSATVAALLGGPDGPRHLREVSKDGETALHVACIRGDAATVRALIAAGADVDATTPDGETMRMTPLMWCTYHGHVEAAAMLLEAGADAGAKNEQGKALLDMSVEAAQPEIEALLRDRLAHVGCPDGERLCSEPPPRDCQETGRECVPRERCIADGEECPRAAHPE